MAESPNSQSRRHLVVSACGAVRGRKAHRHVDGGGSSVACMWARLDAVRPGRPPAHARLAGTGLSHAGEP